VAKGGLKIGDVVLIPSQYEKVTVGKNRQQQIARRAELVRSFKKMMKAGPVVDIHAMTGEHVAGFLLAVESPQKALERVYNDVVYRTHVEFTRIEESLRSVLEA